MIGNNPFTIAVKEHEMKGIIFYYSVSMALILRHCFPCVKYMTIHANLLLGDDLKTLIWI